MSFSIPNTLNLVKNTPITLPTYSGAPDWVSITGAVTNEVLLLVSNAVGGNYTIRTTFTRPASQNIYIDWGDGSPLDTISTITATDSTHTYTGGGTPSSRGYNTWRVRIYGDAGTRITQAQVIRNSADNTLSPSGLIQAWYGDNTVTSMNSYYRNTSLAPTMPFLEYVRIPEGLTAANGLANTFEGCGSLQKVDLPTSLSAITSLDLTFTQCGALQELSNFPVDMTGVTSMVSAFQDCFALPKIIFRNTFPVLTSISSTFRQCWSLGWLELPPLPNCTNYDNAFLNAYTIRSVNFSSIRNTAVSMSATFQNCRKLQNVVLDPNTTATINLAGTFQSCINLKLINLPPNCIVTSYASTFTSCNSLLEVSLPMNGSQITSFQSAFQNCFVLQQITLPSTPPTATTINFGAAFQACNAINEVIIPNGYLITNMGNTFSFCYALQNVSLPQSLSACTSYAACFQDCGAIEYITLPSNSSSVTSMLGAFQNCFSLKEVTFPTSMNACTSIGNLFSSCISLQRVVFPTSMSALGSGTGTLMTNIFNTCRQLRSVVFPSNAPLSTVQNFQAMFNGCNSLQSVTLPAVNSPNVVTLVNFINTTPSLTAITNTDFIGSTGTTTTNYVNATTMGVTSNVLSLDFRCKFSKLDLNGTDTGVGRNALSSLRLRNTGSGQYAGVSPQINISFTNLGQAALVQVFNDLPTVTARTINITSATGAAALTPAERAIATGKGWTIVG